MIPMDWKYPEPVLAERNRVAQTGSLRERIRFDLEGRCAYAWGLLTACDAARVFNIDRITAIEFGVAHGDGLIELDRLAGLVSKETGIGIDVFGFDNAEGLPAPDSYRDHPELWTEGDFAMGDPARSVRSYRKARS